MRESDPPRKLVVSWNVDGQRSSKTFPNASSPTRSKPAGEGVVRLTMTEAHPTPIPAYLLEGGRKGWPMILSGLKSLLETGKPLPIPVPQPPTEGVKPCPEPSSCT